MKTKPLPRKGVARIRAAFFYSLAGLSHAALKEDAFRQELLLYLLLLIGVFWLPVPLFWKVLLVAADTVVLIVELLNSAIEAVVDLVSPEYNAFAGQAKDMGSAAVLLALLMAAGLWIAALYVAMSPDMLN